MNEETQEVLARIEDLLEDQIWLLGEILERLPKRERGLGPTITVTVTPAS